MSRLRLASALVTLVAALAVGGLPAPVAGEPPVFMGIYPEGNLYDFTDKIQAVDTWIASTGKRVAMAGTFMNWEGAPDFTAWWVPRNLGIVDEHGVKRGAWVNGYVPFVTILSQRTLAEINSGVIDTAIANWATAFATWAKPGRYAFIAPLAEMNTHGPTYYGPPDQFIAAYRRIRQIYAAALAAQGVPANAISWVFAPNGWGEPGDEFERYYPGHNEVDVVGFSAYNYGGCPPPAPWLVWNGYDIAFEPFLDRMRAMAPGKPIFLTQTGTVDKPVNGVGDKDQWLRDSFTRLATYPSFRGIMYFDIQLPLNSRPDLPNCNPVDFRLHVPGTQQWQGFKDALTDPATNFGYWAPTSPEIASVVFAPTVPQLFSDVFPVHPWAAEPGLVDFSDAIRRLAASQVTTGCGGGRFCPGDAVSRGQMAVFLLKGIHGAGYGPPNPSGTMFADVTLAHPFVKWIERLATEGITSGCGGSNYCPESGVTRAQMAVFLLKSKHGAAYEPPPASGSLFADVPASNPMAKWIERLAAEGITGGCGGGNYCPTGIVTREQMAVFLVRTFGL